MDTPPKVPGLGAFLEKKNGTPKPPTPPLVSAAARLLYVAAAVQVIASVVAVIYAASPERMDAIQLQIAAMTGNVPSLAMLRNMGILTVVISGIATTAAYVLFGLFLRKGRSWARVAAGVLVLLTVIQLLGIALPEGLTTVVQLVLGGIAVGLCYLPGPNHFFATVKAARN